MACSQMLTRRPPDPSRIRETASQEVSRMTISCRHLSAATFAAALAAAPFFSAAPVQTAAGNPATCESLSGLKLPNTTITAAQTVAPGAFTPPAPARAGGARGEGRAGAAAEGGGNAGRGRAGGAAQVYGTLPSFCRVSATLTPSSDSDIKVEVWLPSAGWNGKFQAVGNGGWAGSIQYQALAQGVAAGYASVSTDTGHTGGTGVFA